MSTPAPWNVKRNREQERRVWAMIPANAPPAHTLHVFVETRAGTGFPARFEEDDEVEGELVESSLWWFLKRALIVAAAVASVVVIGITGLVVGEPVSMTIRAIAAGTCKAGVSGSTAAIAGAPVGLVVLGGLVALILVLKEHEK
jgi:hypothetical protein